VSFDSVTKQWACNPATYYYNKVGYFCYPKSSNCNSPLIYDSSAPQYCSTPLTDYCGPFQYLDSTPPCKCNVSNCMTCTATICSECNPTYFLKVSGNLVECVSSMPSGFGLDTSSNPKLIRPCVIQACTDCQQNYQKCFVCGTVTSPSKCISSAPSCTNNCATCDAVTSSKCYTCNTGFYWDAYTCTDCTANGKFRNGANCTSCHSSCVTCSGPNPTQCLSCTIANPSYYLQDDNSCAACSSVDFGYSILSDSDISKDRCIKCAPPFSKCTGPSTNQGTACFSPATFSSISSPACSTNCAQNEYLNASSSCVSCVNPCASCVSTGTWCLSCVSDYMLLPWNNTCVSNCDSNGLFALTSSSSECGRCDPSCLNCSGPAANNCNSCNTGYYLLNGACTSCDTDPNYAPLGTNCVLCQEGCQTCSNTPTTCLSCKSPDYFKNSVNSSNCITCTALNQYSVGDTCYTCSPNCLACANNPSTCTACTTDLQIMPNSTCDICPQTLYYKVVISANVEYCYRCHSSCLTCSGESPTNCLSCASGNYFYPDLGECRSSCDLQGSFSIGSNCYACSSNCATCALSSTNCTTCPAGNFLLANRSCTKCDQPGFFVFKPNTGQQQCLTCPKNCANCSSTSTCDKCSSGLFVDANNTCVPCSGKRQVSIANKCIDCHANCLTCSGGSDDNCLTCQASKVLSAQNKCIDRPLINFVTANFAPDTRHATFIFDKDVASATSSIGDNIVAFIVQNSKQEVLQLIQNLTDATATEVPGLRAAPGASVVQYTILGKSLRVKIQSNSSLMDAVLLLRFKRAPALQDPTNINTVFPGNYLLIDQLNLVITGFDSAIAAATTSVQTTVTTVTTVMFVVSIPQAFILLKVFQTVDFYIFIDCEFPANFSKFLEIISKNIMDYIPNLLENFADDDGNPLYPRFTDFGESVHIFKNLGQYFTLIIFTALLKVLILLVAKILPKSRFIRSKLLI
jgi:hypothetical protein